MRINSLNKLMLVSLLLISAASCKPDETEVTQDASVANLSMVNATSNNTRVVNFFLGGNSITPLSGVPNTPNTLLGYTILTGTTNIGFYAGVTPGAANISARDTSLAIGTPEYYAQSFNFEPGKSYAFFLYDTLNASNRFRGFFLPTDRTLEPQAATAEVRFLNLSPLSPALDAWFIRQTSNGATPTPALIPKDSVLVSAGQSFVGSLPTIPATLGNFTSVTANQAANSGAGNLATNYLVRVRLAGSPTVVGTSAAFTFVPGKNYTVYVRNKYPTIAFGASVHN